MADYAQMLVSPIQMFDIETRWPSANFQTLDKTDGALSFACMVVQSGSEDGVLDASCKNTFAEEYEEFWSSVIRDNVGAEQRLWALSDVRTKHLHRGPFIFSVNIELACLPFQFSQDAHVRSPIYVTCPASGAIDGSLQALSPGEVVDPLMRERLFFRNFERGWELFHPDAYLVVQPFGSETSEQALFLSASHASIAKAHEIVTRRAASLFTVAEVDVAVLRDLDLGRNVLV